MKQIILLLMLLKGGVVVGQNMLSLPKNPEAGKCYKQCLKYDSTVVNPDPYAVIPPFGWEEVLFQNTEAQQRFEIEAPCFDTVLLKIPVDKVTRMAQLPDEYGLSTERVKTKEASTKWILRKNIDGNLRTHSSNCLAISLYEVPAEYRTIKKLIVKATTHQRRYDDVDTVIFKQVIETQPLKKTVIDIAPQYEKVFRKLNPHASYSEWKEFSVGNESWSGIIRAMQTELKKRGYEAGEIDNVLGTKTKAACIRFQKDNHLPVGTLNLETLRALGLHDFIKE
jgi:Putative peptidoglycan binding domain